MRVHVEKVRMTLHRADVLEAYLNHHDAIVHAAVYLPFHSRHVSHAFQD